MFIMGKITGYVNINFLTQKFLGRTISRFYRKANYMIKNLHLWIGIH